MNDLFPLSDVNNILSNLYRVTKPLNKGLVYPYLKNTEQGYELKFIAAGLSKEEINLDIKEKCLTVTLNPEKKDFMSLYQNFEYQLPDDVDVDTIKATLSKGILHVFINRVQPTPVKKLEIVDLDEKSSDPSPKQDGTCDESGCTCT